MHLPWLERDERAQYGLGDDEPPQPAAAQRRTRGRDRLARTLDATPEAPAQTRIAAGLGVAPQLASSPIQRAKAARDVAGSRA
jgi:hypothetical protein